MKDISNSSKKRKILKWVIGIILFILIAIVAAAVYLAIAWKPILTKTIKNTVVNVSDSLYNADFADVSINLITGSVSMDSLHIRPDTAVYNRMIENRIAPENLFELKVRNLALKNINAWEIFFDKDLNMDAIKILDPELKITYTRFKNKIRKRKDTRTTYEKLKNTLNSAKLNTIALNNVKFEYVDKSLKTPEIIKVDQLHISANDILIDSASQFDTTRIFHTKDIIVELNDYSFPTKDSTYHIKLGQLKLSTRQKNLSIAKFALVPRYEEMAFSNLFPRQNELYRINFDSILVKELNYPDLIESRQIATKSLTIKNGKLYSFLNRGKPSKGIDKGNNFPHVKLNKLNWNIIADTINIKNVDISYAEFNPKSNRKGTINFKGLTGKILNLTNDSARLSQNKYANAQLNTKFMGYGNLDINIKFDVPDNQGRFSYKGSFGAMNLSVLNPIAQPLAKLQFSSGKINRMDFSANGDRNGAKGIVTINYSDLGIKILKQDADDGFKRMGLVSLLANALIIKSDNPSKDEKIRISYPYFARPDDASFFNLMWKIIFIGFKESVGLTKEVEAEMMQKSQERLEKSQKKLEKAKRKEERKEKRKQKREARKND